jgi:hypothetical protein
MEQTNEQPNYYAIIPANVRYAKINANAKLLYGEITALCNKEGYCWASDNYFANLYGVNKSSIQKWLNVLEKSGFIKRKIVYKKGTKIIDLRAIFIIPIVKKEYTPIVKKEGDNNTSNNNTSNNIVTKVTRVNPENDKFSEEITVKKLYYDYLRKYKIPILNHNILRQKIIEFEKLRGTEWCTNYLLFMLNSYNQIQNNYKPEINTALDLYAKSSAIEKLMLKEVELSRVY